MTKELFTTLGHLFGHFAKAFAIYFGAACGIIAALKAAAVLP